MSTIFGPEVGPSFDFQASQPLPQQGDTFGAEVNMTDTAVAGTEESTVPALAREVPERQTILPEDLALNAASVEEEHRLLDIIASGSAGADIAFGALFNRHRGLMLSALKQCPPREREDILQQTALKAYNAIKSGKIDRTTGSLRSWLRTVAHNAGVDKSRHIRVRPQEVLSDDERDHAAIRTEPSSQNVEEIVEARQLAASALAMLTPDHRMVVENVTMQGKTISAYAKESGLSEGTVKSRQFYALRALRRKLRETGYDAS